MSTEKLTNKYVEVGWKKTRKRCTTNTVSLSRSYSLLSLAKNFVWLCVCGKNVCECLCGKGLDTNKHQKIVVLGRLFFFVVCIVLEHSFFFSWYWFHLKKLHECWTESEREKCIASHRSLALRTNLGRPLRIRYIHICILCVFQNYLLYTTFSSFRLQVIGRSGRTKEECKDDELQRFTIYRNWHRWLQLLPKIKHSKESFKWVMLLVMVLYKTRFLFIFFFFVNIF